MNQDRSSEGPYKVMNKKREMYTFSVIGPGVDWPDRAYEGTAKRICEIANTAHAEGRKAAEKEIEEKKAVKDALLCGTGFMKDGKRVPPEDVYLSEAEIKLKKVEKDFKELLHLANEASYLNQDSMAWGIKYADWKKARGIISGCYAGNNAGFTPEGNVVAAFEYADLMIERRKW